MSASVLTRERRHTAIILACWTLWPALLGVLTLGGGVPRATVLFIGSAVAAIGAAAFASSSRRALQTVGAVVVFLIWLPWIARIVERFSLSFGVGILAVADSPLAFLTIVFAESLFVAPLPVFATSIWRRRDP